MDRYGDKSASSEARRRETGPTTNPRDETQLDLRWHGDVEVGPGLVDLAVNVRHAPMPSWLAEALTRSMSDLARYPDPDEAITAVAARHGRDRTEVLPTAGAAQAFVLLAQALQPRYAVVVHPQFTEPEAALRAAGHHVHRVVLPPPYELTPSLVPDEADLVIVGNPTNPTSVAHRAGVVAELVRPGRILVVDEAFADTVTGTAVELAGRADLPGLIVIRSLTKTWALAGLRVGYLLASPELVARLGQAQPLWAVSTPALAAMVACSSPAALAETRAWAATLAHDRAYLVSGLSARPGVELLATSASSFVLVRIPGAMAIRGALRECGFAVRRGDTFPGLGPDFVRIAVRDRATTDAFLAALSGVIVAAG